MSDDDLRRVLARARDVIRELFEAPYRRTLARSKRDEDDLFMLLVFSEMMGIPNPASYYTLELLPILYERFHEWHVRIGLEKSPLDNIRCC